MSARPRVLILHAYSSENAGDGILVDHTIALVREALGEAEVTLLASRPDSFSHLGIRVLPTVPTWKGWDARTRRTLRSIDEFDVVLGVGGGYLRFGTPREALKTALVMGPQLAAAARTTAPTIYLPQSIGPARFGTLPFLRRLLQRIDSVMVRDDRSISEIDVHSAVRSPDLAAASVRSGRSPGVRPSPIPVLSVRAVRGRIAPAIYALANSFSTYDGYTQSTVGGNDDRPAMATLAPRRMLDREAFMMPGGQPRVLVAVRLHAALMALAAGHYVVHLAYERKGFGAFDDLGLSPWVHSVNTFDPEAVTRQTRLLLDDDDARADYEARLVASGARLQDARSRIVDRISGV